MIRAAFFALFVLSLLPACAALQRPETAAAKVPQFSTNTDKEIACNRLGDHIVTLFADEWARKQGFDMSDDERERFHAGWSQELNDKGAIARFAASCRAGLTPRKYDCGMASRTKDGLVACMKLSENDSLTRTSVAQ